MSNASGVPAETLERLAEPLREEVRRREDELFAVDLQRDALLAELKQLRGALDRLLPSVTKKKGPEAQVASKRVGEIERFILAHPGELADGFTASKVAAMLNQNGDPVGKDTVRKAVIVLHERGVLRLDRRGGIGGGKIYKLIS